jgi:Fe2+ or Zn2+ uptake regulation protein
MTQPLIPPVGPGESWTCAEGHRHFVCIECEEVFTTNTTPEESAAEAQEVLGEVPEPEDRVSVCDDCYPILIEQAKALGLL